MCFLRAFRYLLGLSATPVSRFKRRRGMMLVGSLKEPCHGCVQIFIGAEPILKIYAERSLRGCKALFCGKLHEAECGCCILIVVTPAVSAFFLIVLPELKLPKGIAHFRYRSGDFSCLQFASPEPAKSVFF